LLNRLQTSDAITTQLDMRVLLFYLLLTPGSIFDSVKHLNHILPDQRYPNVFHRARYFVLVFPFYLQRIQHLRDGLLVAKKQNISLLNIRRECRCFPWPLVVEATSAFSVQIFKQPHTCCLTSRQTTNILCWSIDPECWRYCLSHSPKVCRVRLSIMRPLIRIWRSPIGPQCKADLAWGFWCHQSKTFSLNSL